MTNGELTEVERLKLENYALRHGIMQAQIKELLAERAGYIRQVEMQHPGYRWDESKGLIATPTETDKEE